MCGVYLVSLQSPGPPVGCHHWRLFSFGSMTAVNYRGIWSGCYSHLLWQVNHNSSEFYISFFVLHAHYFNVAQFHIIKVCIQMYCICIQYKLYCYFARETALSQWLPSVPIQHANLEIMPQGLVTEQVSSWTEQIECRKSDTIKVKKKKPVNFQNKATCTDCILRGQSLEMSLGFALNNCT